jgi:hypothetical protein
VDLDRAVRGHDRLVVGPEEGRLLDVVQNRFVDAVAVVVGGDGEALVVRRNLVVERGAVGEVPGAVELPVDGGL